MPFAGRAAKTLLRRKTAVKGEIVYTSSFDMKMGDRLIFFSDGVAQSGIVLGSLPGLDTERLHSVGEKMGEWGTDNVRDFVHRLLQKTPDINSRDLARAIVTEAYKRDHYRANDDITCAVVSVRKPKRAMLVTGAPRSRESDKRLGEMIKKFDGRVIVCGGTTAKIVARELGKDVKADRSPSGNLPPASITTFLSLFSIT